MSMNCEVVLELLDCLIFEYKDDKVDTGRCKKCHTPFSLPIAMVFLLISCFNAGSVFLLDDGERDEFVKSTSV
jgi:hypothetical protein